MQVPAYEPEAQTSDEKKRNVYVREVLMPWVDEGHISFSVGVDMAISKELVEVALMDTIFVGGISRKKLPLRVEYIACVLVLDEKVRLEGEEGLVSKMAEATAAYLFEQLSPGREQAA